MNWLSSTIDLSYFESLSDQMSAVEAVEISIEAVTVVAQSAVWSTGK